MAVYSRGVVVVGEAMTHRANFFLVRSVLALAMFRPAIAGPLEDGYAAYRNSDYAAAMNYWRPLAEQNNAVAQVNLGLMYRKGLGVPQDNMQALVWYRKAADQGNDIAQLRLSLMYEGGLGAPQDYVQARMWANIAASLVPDAKYRATAVLFRDFLVTKMTPAQIAEAQRLATEWKPTK